MFKIVCNSGKNGMFLSRGPLRLICHHGYRYSDYTQADNTAELEAPPHTIEVFDNDVLEITWDSALAQEEERRALNADDAGSSPARASKA